MDGPLLNFHERGVRQRVADLARHGHNGVSPSLDEDRILLSILARANLRLVTSQISAQEEGQTAGDGTRNAPSDQIQPVVLVAEVVGFVAQRTGPRSTARAGFDGDDAGLGIAELGRNGAGGDRRLLEGVDGHHVGGGAEGEGGAKRRAVLQLDAVTAPRLGRDAVDVQRRLVGPAAADEQRAAAGARHDARLQHQHLVQHIYREILGVVAVQSLLSGDLVPGHQRVDGGHHSDLFHLERGGLERHVLGQRLVAEDLEALDPG